MKADNKTYMVHKEDGLYYVTASIGCGANAYGTHMVVLEGSPLTVITNRFYEKLGYRGEVLEDRIFSIHKIPVKVQKIYLDRFLLGSLDLGSKPIWRTVDIDIDTNILGADILSTLECEEKNDCMYFREKRRGV